MQVDTQHNLKLFWNISLLQWFCDTGQQIEMMNVTWILISWTSRSSQKSCTKNVKKNCVLAKI